MHECTCKKDFKPYNVPIAKRGGEIVEMLSKDWKTLKMGAKMKPVSVLWRQQL